MPKATLTFNLPAEALDHNLALKGHDFFDACQDFDLWLEKQIDAPHNQPSPSADVVQYPGWASEVFREIRKVYLEYLGAQGIRLNNDFGID